MDSIFQSDKQLFVSKPILFSSFLAEGVQSRKSLEFQTDQTKYSNRSLQTRFSQKVNLSSTSTQEIFDSLIEFNSYYNKKQEDKFCFDAPIESFPNVKLKTLKYLRHERNKRLNRQYKSASLRLLRYDMIDEKYISYKPSNLCDRQSTDFDQTTFCNEQRTQHDAIPSSVELRREHMSVMNEASIVLQNDETATFFENNGLAQSAALQEELRSDNLFWGKDDLIASISIFVGYARQLRKHEIRMGRLLKVASKILLSGENTLYDLRECLFCPEDYMFSRKCTRNETAVLEMNKSLFPSSFFFIHDTFYIDDKTPNAIDLTEPIRLWAARKNMIGPLKLNRMSEVKIKDITARFGQPYVFVHSGTCEHLVCFNDLWLRSHSDIAGPFPLKLVRKKFKCIKCAGCKKDTAEWRVEESSQLPQDPLFFCNECYREFLFDENGNKVGQFRSFPYLDRQMMDEAGFFYQKLSEQFENDDY